MKLHINNLASKLKYVLIVCLAAGTVTGSFYADAFISKAKDVNIMDKKSFERLTDSIFRYNDGATFTTTGNVTATTRTANLDTHDLIEVDHSLPLDRWRGCFNGGLFHRAGKYGGEATLFEIKDLNATITFLYKHIATKDGKPVDCKVTYSGWVPTNDYDSTIWKGYSYPCIDISSCITDGYWSEFLKQFNISMEFVYADGSPVDTKEFYLYNGSMNLGEGIVAPSNAKVIALMKDTNVKQSSDGVFVGDSSYFNDAIGGEATTAPDGKLLKAFDANAVSMKCLGNSTSYTVFQKSIKNSDLMGGTWATEVNTGEGNGPNSDFWNPISFAPLNTSTAPLPKKVAVAGGVETDHVDGLDVGDKLTFKVKQEVEILGMNGSAKYDSFSFKDVLPAELNYENAYLQDEGTGRQIPSSDYTLSVQGKTITAAFKQDYLKNTMRYEGETYSLVVQAAVNDSTYAMTPFDNRASTTIDGNEANTNLVRITARPPVLAIKKTASKYEWQVGDQVDYTVNAAHAPGSSKIPVKNLVVSDLSLPEGLQVTDYAVIGVPGAAVQKTGTGWTATAGRMEYGQTLAVTFHCLATEAVNGKETSNTATAHGDNAAQAQDQAEVYINTAKLALTKDVSRYEWRAGEAVDYTVRLQNTKAGTIARNVSISDLTLPKGLELTEAPVVTGAPATIHNPIAGNSGTPGETQSKQVAVQSEKTKKGWNASISDLPAGQEVTITFHCKALEAVNGMEIINTAHARADNAPDVKDDAKIWVNSPGLKLEKKADMEKVKVGDMVTYTLTLTNGKAGTVAHDVEIEDALDESSAKFSQLQKNSIVLTDSEGNKIDDAKITVKGNSFHIETGRNLANGKSNYGIWDLEHHQDPQDGGKPNPENVKKETKLQVEYQVKVTSELAAGETIHNVATATSKEDIPTKAEEDVKVNGPHLDVEKTSDKQAYGTAETAKYQIIVRQTREGYQAKDVAVKDRIEQPGATIDGKSIQVKVNGKKIVPVSLKMDEDGMGYAMETGVTLGDEDKMKITYDVHFQELSDKDQNKQFTNHVTAKGSNTNEGGDDNTVTVTEKDAALAVVKQSDKWAYQVGDTAKYTLLIFQQRDDAIAKQVTIRDAFAQEGMVIQEDTIKVQVNGKEIKPKSISLNEAKNSFVIETGSDLSSRDKMTVTYDVKFERPIQGEKADNTATVQGDNTNQGIDDHTVDVKQTVPVLLVQKRSDKGSYQVGETGRYQAKVTQTEHGGVARQVIFKDGFDKAGMKIIKDTIRMEYKGKELQPKSLVMNEAQNGFTMETGIDLAWTESITVTYDVKFEQPVKGDKITNTASAKAQNAKEEKFPWTVSLREVVPEISLLKKADKDSYQVGETGKYKLLIEQKKENAVAKQVVVKDSFDQEGMKIQEDTIQVKVNGKEIKPRSVTLSEAKNGFAIETGADLSSRDKMTVTYDVKFEQPVEDGTAVNSATAKPDNGEGGKDRLETQIVSPELELKKTVDKEEAKKGDILAYTLSITGKSQKSANVCVEDALKHEGARLLPETIKVSGKDGSDVTKDCKITADDRGFAIETGKTLAPGEKLVVTYGVKLDDVHPGDTVENAALSWGDNTPRAKAQAEVLVPSIAAMVKTGLQNHAALYGGIGTVLLLVAGGLLLKRKKRPKDR